MPAIQERGGEIEKERRRDKVPANYDLRAVSLIPRAANSMAVGPAGPGPACPRLWCKGLQRVGTPSLPLLQGPMVATLRCRPLGAAVPARQETVKSIS